MTQAISTTAISGLLDLIEVERTFLSFKSSCIKKMTESTEVTFVEVCFVLGTADI